MTAENQAKFINDFREYVGFELEEIAGNIQPLSMTATALINRTENIILTEIKKRNPTFREDKLSEYEKEIIYRSILEQIAYMCTAGDYTLIVGYDAVANSLADAKQLRKRSLAPLAKDMLLSAGLFYSGIGGHGADDYRWRYRR